MLTRCGKNWMLLQKRKEKMKRFGDQQYEKWTDAGNMWERRVSCVRWSGRCNAYNLNMNQRLLDNGVVCGSWQTFKKKQSWREHWKCFNRKNVKSFRFSQRLLIRWQFYFGFVYRVAVKCSDVSEGRTAFLLRTNKLPSLEAPVMGGNI